MHFNAFVLTYITVSCIAVYNKTITVNCMNRVSSCILILCIIYYYFGFPVYFFINMAAKRFSTSEAINIILNDDSDSSGDGDTGDVDDEDYLPEDTVSEN